MHVQTTQTSSNTPPLLLTHPEWLIIQTREHYAPSTDWYPEWLDTGSTSITGRAIHRVAIQFRTDSARSMFMLRDGEYIG